MTIDDVMIQGCDSAQIVDDDPGSLACELEGMGAPNASPRAGHNDNPAFADPTHGRTFLSSEVPG